MLRGITAEIDLEAASCNLASLKEAAGGLPVIAVVKADAYGHGAVQMSGALAGSGAAMLAVAFLSEAVELREAGIRAPILVLFDSTNPRTYMDLHLTPVIHDLKFARALSEEAVRRGRPLEAHLKVDTGMSRMGLNHMEDLPAIASLDGLKITGLMSHFSDADGTDANWCALQLDRFKEAREALINLGHGGPLLCHMANSAAALSMKDAHLDAIRPGLSLYGISPFAESRPHAVLKPIMRALARIVTIKRIPKGQPVSYGRTFTTTRDTTVAVLGAGYADGYMRAFSGKAEVLIRGKRAAILGRLCMDLCMADITEIEGVTEKDPATLLGRDGKEEITAWQLARHADTIPYEVLISIGKTARRAYLASETANG